MSILVLLRLHFITPDGIVSSLADPWFGREGDWGMYIDSGLERHLRRINDGIEPNDGYKATIGLPLDPILKAINMHMSSMRISVEHGFGKMMNLWSFNGFKRNVKSGLSPIAGYFLVACFLSNIHSCLYRNETRDQFHCNLPSLSRY
ncbi:hypothetical protein L873DRAFT_1811989 [Choiromyces venosus 120613-1]|uniref:DDE Tnp4 domain-containing protein n=1 Tax=Choiromyces venosus 120613-1 TaxID=1336337 RepID=A0A3N4JGW5_9PEZI|nr:hypothetical protein L873DRAFT_1811989 [Choiromyces venosus 120613-1]